MVRRVTPQQVMAGLEDVAEEITDALVARHEALIRVDCAGNYYVDRSREDEVA